MHFLPQIPDPFVTLLLFFVFKWSLMGGEDYVRLSIPTPTTPTWPGRRDVLRDRSCDGAVTGVGVHAAAQRWRGLSLTWTDLSHFFSAPIGYEIPWICTIQTVCLSVCLSVTPTPSTEHRALPHTLTHSIGQTTVCKSGLISVCSQMTGSCSRTVLREGKTVWIQV